MKADGAGGIDLKIRRASGVRHQFAEDVLAGRGTANVAHADKQDADWLAIGFHRWVAVRRDDSEFPPPGNGNLAVVLPARKEMIRRCFLRWIQETHEILMRNQIKIAFPFKEGPDVRP
ncbi:MAG: hypothetical protein MUF04_05535, partial [Akkermansiaceae bacterium]|nr:hypothetical protein [Akkermansiaceae bacterium]